MSLNKLQQQLKKKEKERKADAGKKQPMTEEVKKKQAADNAAFMCQVCRQTFMVTSTKAALEEHASNKHPKLAAEACFASLKATT